MVKLSRILLPAATVVACASAPKRLVLPPEMQPPISPQSTATPAQGTKATTDAALTPPKSSGYVMRLAESGRIWEFELPQDGSGYEVRVPLTGAQVPEALTLADQELLSAPPPAGAPTSAVNENRKKVDAQEATQRSLLTGFARITEFYRQRRYELALIEAADLEKTYPNEPRVHAMKGSLYLHLGKRSLAKASYQKALSLDPADITVAEALRELSDKEDR